MKIRLLSGYGIRKQDKENQQSLDVEVRAERTGMSLSTDRQLVIEANGEEFMRFEIQENGWLDITVNEISAATPRFKFPPNAQAEAFGSHVYVEIEAGS